MARPSTETSYKTTYSLEMSGTIKVYFLESPYIKMTNKFYDVRMVDLA